MVKALGRRRLNQDKTAATSAVLMETKAVKEEQAVEARTATVIRNELVQWNNVKDWWSLIVKDGRQVIL